MRSTQSPSLRSRYDYYYSALSPGSSAVNFYENQNLSLFGDPVPPATDFLETLDNHLYGSFQRTSSSSDNNNHAVENNKQMPIPYNSRDYIRVVSSSGSGSGSSMRKTSQLSSDDRINIIGNNVGSNMETFQSFRKRSISSFSDDVRAIRFV